MMQRKESYSYRCFVGASIVLEWVLGRESLGSVSFENKPEVRLPEVDSCACAVKRFRRATVYSNRSVTRDKFLRRQSTIKVSTFIFQLGNEIHQYWYRLQSQYRFRLKYIKFGMAYIWLIIGSMINNVIFQ